MCLGFHKMLYFTMLFKKLDKIANKKDDTFFADFIVCAEIDNHDFACDQKKSVPACTVCPTQEFYKRFIMYR